MKHLLLLWFAFLTAAITLAGPVVIDGTDGNDHGSSLTSTNVTGGVVTNNVDGWLYMQRVLENLASQVDISVVKVVVDLGTDSDTRANDAITSAFALSTLPAAGWTITNINGESAIDAWLENLSTANTGILYIPSAGNSFGDLEEAELQVINGRGPEITDFVAGDGVPLLGGGLFAMGESPFSQAVTPYGWLIDVLPDIEVTDVGGGGISTDLSLTIEGEDAFPGLTSQDLSSGPWHNFFEGDFGGLDILATAPDDSGVTRNIIIGGGAGASFQPLHSNCVTRTARFWFTHADADGSTTNCVTLLRAIRANSKRISLGFILLPTGFHDDDPDKDEHDALVEALAFFWRSSKLTGELGGTQNARLRGARLCRQRKRLAVELIAATANVRMLGTSPLNCTFIQSGVLTNFSRKLLVEARKVAATEDLNAIRAMTTLLRKFNGNGLTNNFFGTMVECSPSDTTTLRALSRDPTSRFSCPGVSDNCASAEAIVFPTTGSVFQSARFRSKASTTKLPSGEAWWKIETDVALSNRTFTVNTFGSNFDTLLTVFSGACQIVTSNGVEVASTSGLSVVDSNDDAEFTPQSQVSFTTTGGQTYFIQVSGGVGQIKFTATSP